MRMPLSKRIENTTRPIRRIPRPTSEIGLILTDKDKFAEALTYLEVTNMLAPNDPDVLAAMAKGYNATNRPEIAVDLLKKAKAVKPNDPNIRFQLYDFYRKTGQDKKAAARDQATSLRLSRQ